MKRLAVCFSLVLLFCVFFTSCTESPREYLEYQQYPFSLEAEVTLNDMTFEAQICVDSPDSGSITFISPDRLSGISFVTKEGAVAISYDGLYIDLNGSQLLSIWSDIISLFCLKTECVTGAKVESIDTVPVNVIDYYDSERNIRCTLTVDGRNGLPLSIDYHTEGKNIFIKVKNFTAKSETDTTQ